jgi:hypothetical protein
MPSTSTRSKHIAIRCPLDLLAEAERRAGGGSIARAITETLRKAWNVPKHGNDQQKETDHADEAVF